MEIEKNKLSYLVVNQALKNSDGAVFGGAQVSKEDDCVIFYETLRIAELGNDAVGAIGEPKGVVGIFITLVIKNHHFTIRNYDFTYQSEQALGRLTEFLKRC